MTRTITIEDTLQERVDSAIEEVRELLEDYLKDNPDTEETPCLHNDLDYSGAAHEIIDRWVPIFTHEIKSTMFLYGDMIEEAFDTAGIGSKDDEWPMGWEAAAINCYIEQQVVEWYQSEASAIFEQWQDSQPR
jgi:hypothetical protein